MKHTLNYVNTGGFPFDVDKLEDIQQAYSIFESMAHIAGDKVIITGCVDTAGIVSDGIIAINGLLFPFVGGAVGTEVGITTVVSTLPYEDGVARNYKTANTASFAVGTGIMWADFERINSLRNKVDINQWVDYTPTGLIFWETNPYDAEGIMTGRYIVIGNVLIIFLNIDLGGGTAGRIDVDFPDGVNLSNTVPLFNGDYGKDFSGNTVEGNIGVYYGASFSNKISIAPVSSYIEGGCNIKLFIPLI